MLSLGGERKTWADFADTTDVWELRVGMEEAAQHMLETSWADIKKRSETDFSSFQGYPSKLY